MRGACAFVAATGGRCRSFAEFPQASGLFLPCSDGVELTEYLAPVLATHAEFFDVMVATFFTTVRPLRESWVVIHGSGPLCRITSPTLTE